MTTLPEAEALIAKLTKERDELQRKVEKLELKLVWTRRWNELIRKKSEDLIDEMAEQVPKAARDYDEADARRKGDGQG